MRKGNNWQEILLRVIGLAILGVSVAGAVMVVNGTLDLAGIISTVFGALMQAVVWCANHFALFMLWLCVGCIVFILLVNLMPWFFIGFIIAGILAVLSVLRVIFG